MSHYFIGVDVGGTKTEACLLALSDLQNFEHFQVLARERITTSRVSLAQFLSELNTLIQKLLSNNQTGSHVDLKQIRGIGVGLPGSIDPITQIMAQGSISFFKDCDLKAEFSKALSFNGPMIFDNDGNCFALAETYLGAGKRWAEENNVPLDRLCLVGITLGTGVGGGLIVNGKLIRGRRGGAGEIGHITLVEAGRLCYCGKRGCSEQYLSGKAFEYAYATRASALEHLEGTEIFKLAEKNEPLAVSAIEMYRDHLVTFLSNVSNFVDPHVIVLGGGMSTQPRIYQGIAERLSLACFLTENPPGVLQNECGGSAGVLGAALLSIWENQ